jgi:protein gp37
VYGFCLGWGMAHGSKIEWTEGTWNPITGCTKVSPGCRHCYAERMSRRLQAMGVPQYKDAFRLALHPEVLDLPRRWRKPRFVFVNSMSDLFHESVPLGFVQRVFGVMQEVSQHQFQVLTKRPEIALEYAGELPWPGNVWLGTSVENAEYVWRVRTLQKIPAKIRFLSVEPLLGPIPRLPLRNIHWVIVGGESGPGARPMEEPWVTQIRDRCVTYGVSFFFKQWGGVNKKRMGRALEGRTWDEVPFSGARCARRHAASGRR